MNLYFLNGGLKSVYIIKKKLFTIKIFIYVKIN